MKNIILTKTTTKKGIATIEIKTIDKEQYDNMTNKDALKFFRGLGGSETTRKSYTSSGYVVTKLISRSPCRTIKVVCEFNLDEIH